MKEINSFKAIYKENFHKGITINPTPIFMIGWPIGLIDGASQLRDTHCGVEVVLKLVDWVVCILSLGCKEGTNIRGELLSLWVLLFFFSLQKNRTTSEVVGDSKLIIDGTNKGCRL